jgi:hypothetical protein
VNRVRCGMAVLVGFAVTGSTFAQAPKPEARETVTVPFTLLPSRHMVIEAKVDGKGPYKFVFDTGAPINLVSSKVAKDAGLSGGMGGLGMLLAGPQQSKIGKLTVGGTTAEKVPAMVLDHPTVRAISDAFKAEVGPLQGIIGFPFFARYAMAIDYQKKELTLTPTDYVPGDYLEDMIARLNAAAANGAAPKVYAPAGLWGLTVEKPAGDDEAGVIVKAIADVCSAAKAGLKVGDRVLTIDGRWTDSLADAALAAGYIKPGRTVEVKYIRDGKERTTQVTPANGL